MAVLTAPRDNVQFGDAAVLQKHVYPVGANVQLYPGGLAYLSGGNLLEVAAAANTDGCIPGIVTNPVHTDQLNNLTGNPFGNSGAAGAFLVEVTAGEFDFVSGSGAEAITAANIGEICYAIDDQTVGLTSSLGARPIAGKVTGLDAVSGQVRVLVGFVNADEGITIAMPAAAAIAQGTIVSVNASGQVAASTLGQMPFGVCQNAPAGVNAYAKVRVNGIGLVVSGAAITVGMMLESTASGQAKQLVLSSGAGITGGTFLGWALTAVGGAGLLFLAYIAPAGAVPTTAA